MPDETSNKSQFWFWVNKNVTGYGILVALWLLSLVLLAVLN